MKAPILLTYRAAPSVFGPVIPDFVEFIRLRRIVRLFFFLTQNAQIDPKLGH